jgi:ribitol-5-phosphate 2-dehydrogenase
VTIERKVGEGQVAIQPTISSICHADLRYYTGNRRPEALAKKLPMALLHEGLGTIVESKFDGLSNGQRVVIVPNIPGYLLNRIDPQDCCHACRKGIGDNYCQNGVFLGSGFDGIGQSRLVIPGECALPVPDHIPDDIAVLTELCSVSCRAGSIVEKQLAGANVAVFGDGPVGYLTAAMLHHVFGVSSDRLHVFGAIREKLDKFTFAQRAMVQEYDFQNGIRVDVAFECTGGRFSESAINQAIDIMCPGGDLVILGVTEERVPINTRDVLERGITIHGSSRSSIRDFARVLKTMEDPACRKTLTSLVPDQHNIIHGVKELTDAMETTAAHKDWKKTYLNFDWQQGE